MSLKNMLGSVAIVGALAALSTGCVVRAHGRVSAPVAYVEVYEEPPPPQVVVYDTRPGFIWVQGRWLRSGNQWVWRDGYWQRERAGYMWEQGRWERRGRGHVWVEGSWRTGGGNARANPGRGNPNVRDHRTNQPAQPPPPGPAVRDHRRR
jgi:hypothetical protein